MRGRPPIGDRPMTAAERMKLHRAKQRARKEAEAALQVGEAQAVAAAVAAQRGTPPLAVLPPVARGAPPIIAAQPQAPPPAPAPPPLPERKGDRIAAILAGAEAALWATIHDPATKDADRIAATRTLLEMTGQMRARAKPPTAEELRRQDHDAAVDPARLLAAAEQRGQEIERLEQMLAQAERLEAQGAAAMPWD